MRGATRATVGRRRTEDRGQAVLAMAFVVVIAAVAAGAVARLGAELVLGQQAQAAADAVALAAAQGDGADVGRVATANMAEVVRVTRLGDDVIVEVRVHAVRAVARATRAP